MKANTYTLKLLFLAMVPIMALFPGKAQAQQIGFANSNYAGTNSLYTNPSAIADSRHAFYLSLFSVEAGALNNYVSFEAPVSLLTLFKDGLELEPEYLKETLNGKPKIVTVGIDFRGPSFMLRLSPKNSIAVTTRLRGGVHISNLSEDITQLYQVQEGQADDLINKVSKNNTFNFNENLHSEIGFSYAHVIVNKGKHFVKGGFTIKKLAGFSSAHIINEETEFKLEEVPVGSTGENDYVVHLNNTRMKYGYLTENPVGDLDISNVLNMLAGTNSLGKGWGSDFGLTYEFRPKHEKYLSSMDGKEVEDQEKNKYKLRLGIAVMDLGGITYDNPAYVKGYDLEKNNKQLRLTDFENTENTEDYFKVFNNALDVTEADKVTSFRSKLPAALNINIDYKIAGPLYANATWIKNLRGINAIGMKQHSLLAFTPRLEFKKFELAMPVALQNNYSVRTVGAMVRIANFFVGSDNLEGAFINGNPYGANVYAGFALLPILKRNKKDRDKDGVSNKKDKCKKVPGKWELMGCPD